MIAVRHILTVVLVIFCFCSVWGQGVLDSANRPKVGLALSGGAAHGMAHIGVLRYLEELGIKPDYITGTSMGSVIGGLYAMGFDSDQIAEIAGELDWDLIMSNRVPLTEIAPIEKNDHGKIPFAALWKNSSLRLPRGFIRGQKLDLAVSKVYCPAHFIDNFDELHIPFRCVAVDIEDGSIDLLDKGYLGNSIRASMAIPSVFPPKLLNDRLYVDGGLLRNFPVQEAIDMGSDIVIGVYVGSARAKREDLHSMFDVLRQSTAMANLIDSEVQQEQTDILIVPDVRDKGSFDFKNYAQLIRLGYEAAKVHKASLIKLADKIRDYSEPERGEKLEYPTSLRFSEVTTNLKHPAYQKLVNAKVKGWENYAISLDEIENTLSLIYGTKNFSSTSYSFYKTEEGTGLELIAEEADPFSIGLNINRFNLYNSAFVIAAEARNVIGKPSLLRMNARISDFPGISGEYYIRFPQKPSLIFRTSGKIEKFRFPLFDRSIKKRSFDYEQGYLKFELINEWRNKYLFSFGYQFLHDELKPEVNRVIDLVQYQSERNQIFGELSYNDLDRPTFPKEGKITKLNLAYNFNNLVSSVQNDSINLLAFQNDKSYGTVASSYNQYFSLNRQFVFHLGLKAVYMTGQNLLDSYKVGGPVQDKGQAYGFIGLDDSQLLLGSHVSARLELRMRLIRNLYLSPVIEVLHGDDYTSEDFGVAPNLTVLGGGLDLGYNSPIGPVHFSIGYSDLADRVILNLGIGYRHIK